MSFEHGESLDRNEVAIRVQGVGKCYPIYDVPADRLRQFLMPPLWRLLRREPVRYHREFWALRDVDFEVMRGEQLGVVGRNGAGKSTLLQIICGTLAPTTGSVEVSGRIAALLELGAGFNPELTGRENIFLNGSVLGLTQAQIEQRFDGIVAFADIPGFIDQPVKHYSSGMFMRLGFAVAVHVEPDILVVDEALSVGDEAYQRKCHARIRRLRDDGATILFVSHSAGHVTEVCDRAVLIDHGRLLSVGSAKQVISRYQKLLYAPPGREAQVRQALLDEHAGQTAAQADADGPSEPPRREMLPADFDEGLVPTSTVHYPARGCRIDRVRIETPDGERVNVLRPGDEYVYAYRVEFDQPAVAVRFGLMIKSMTGVELAGAVSHAQGEPLPQMPAGSSVDVRFVFRNVFNPGTYFLNAGVVGMDGEHETHLARSLDVAMFRVRPDPDATATGFMDMYARCTVVAT